MNRKLLVVNADDLGFAPDVNASIEALHRAGIVTSASLMVDGKHVADALTIIHRNPRLGVGLHLDLCPVVGLYSLPYNQMRERLSNPDIQNAVAAEVDRQITAFKRYGLEFTHLDSHRHFHALPELFALVVEVSARHGAKSMRLTKNWLLPRTPSVHWDEDFFHDARHILHRRSIRFPDNFIYGWRDYSLLDCRPGLNELMVHVGSADAEYSREYALLSSLAFRQSLEATEVELRSYQQITRGHLE